MMWGWGSASWISWLVMSLVMVVFWGGLVAVIVWAIRGTGRPASRTSDAESILEERFARGEIDAEELETKRSTLRSGSRRRPA
jgi:putative membrane protein